MVIGIAGKKQVGKDTAADILLNDFFLKDQRYSKYKFADTIKIMTATLLNCSVDDLEDETFKSTPLPEEWDKWKFVTANLDDNEYSTSYFATQKELEDAMAKNVEDYVILAGKVSITPREIMQLMGTEFGRNMIHPNIWVMATMNRIGKNDNAIIPDVRFPNEVDAIKKYGGIIIYIERDTGLNDNHPSEKALDDYPKDKFDVYIDNNKTIDDLKTELEKAMLKIKEREIKLFCAEAYDVSLEDMDSDRQYRDMSDARHLYWYFLFYSLGYRVTDIAKIANRNHSTIIYGIKKTLDLIDLDYKTEANYNDISDKLC